MRNLIVFKTDEAQKQYNESDKVIYPFVQFNEQHGGISCQKTEGPKQVTFWFNGYTDCSYTLESTTTWEVLINNFYDYFENDYECQMIKSDTEFGTLYADNEREYVYSFWCDGTWVHLGGSNCWGTARLSLLKDSDGNYVKKTDLIKSGCYTMELTDEEVDNPQTGAGGW